MFTIYIFCKGQPVPDTVIEEFLAEGAFTNHNAVITRPLKDVEHDKPFKTLKIDYAPGRTCITIACHHVTETGKAHKERSDLLYILNLPSRYPEKKAVVQEWIQQCQWIFTLEFNREELSDENDDAWELLDHVEAAITRQCMGLICADGTFYNEKLKKMYTL